MCLMVKTIFNFAFYFKSLNLNSKAKLYFPSQQIKVILVV